MVDDVCNRGNTPELGRGGAGFAVTVAVAVALAGVVPAGSEAHAASPEQEAREFFEEGAELFARERYAEAARALAKSYALDPKPELLFAWGQAERLSGNCEEALRLYERFLETGPAAKERAHTEEVIDLCEDATREVPPPPSAPDATEDGGGGGKEARGEDSERDRHRHDRVAVGLMATGGVLLAGGAASLVVGGVLDARAANAETYRDLERYRDPATGQGKGAVPAYIAGGALVGVGLGLLVGGIVRHVRHDPRVSRAWPSQIGIDAKTRHVQVRWRF